LQNKKQASCGGCLSWPPNCAVQHSPMWGLTSADPSVQMAHMVKWIPGRQFFHEAWESREP
jgi:hypothetical protein